MQIKGHWGRHRAQSAASANRWPPLLLLQEYSFYCTSLYCLLQIFFFFVFLFSSFLFNKLKVCGNPELSGDG